MSLKFIPPWIPKPVCEADVHEDDELGVVIGLVHLTQKQTAAKAVAEAKEDADGKRRRANVAEADAARAERKLSRLIEAQRQLEEDGTWDDCLIPTLEKARKAQDRYNANAQNAKLVAHAVELGFLSNRPSKEVKQFGAQNVLRNVVLANARADFFLHKFFTDENGNRVTVYVQPAVKCSDADVAEQLNRAYRARMKSSPKKKTARQRNGTEMLEDAARQQLADRTYQEGLFWREAWRKDHVPWYGGMNAREVAACELPCVRLGVMENGRIGAIKRSKRPFAPPVNKSGTGVERGGHDLHGEQPPPSTGPPH